MRVAKPKPCPFCHSSDTFVERMEISSWQMVCNECFAHGPSVCDANWEEDKANAEATRAWNQRRRALPGTAL